MNRVSELAIISGQPRFREPLHVGRPNIGDPARLHARVSEAISRRWFTNSGPLVTELEARLADFLGVRHCILTCNGTVALEIAARALNLAGEVIVPSFTFVATAHALQWQEITPVFCDIDPRTHGIDPTKLERLITPRTTGIIGVHLWGNPCDTAALEEIARRRRLALMYDAAHAFACSHGGSMIGSFGNAEVFSFHATKVFHTFEGGAVATNDDSLARKIRLMKNFGFSGFDNVIYVGTNGKMNEISAAMGLTCLDGLSDFITVNRRHYLHYRDDLDALPGIRVYPHSEIDRRNYHYVVLEVDAGRAGMSRDLLLEVLHKENILARRYFYPGCHRMEPYRSYFPHAGLLLPETEALSERILVLPTGTAVTEADIATVCAVIRCAIENAEELALLRASESSGIAR